MSFQSLEDLAEALETVLPLMVCTELINTDLVKAQKEVRNVDVGCGLIGASNRNQPPLDVLVLQVIQGQMLQVFDVLM